ncbi:MAG: aminomethyl-transferring glycine dehydrogenase subunit GcvPA [Deltaproteobacteria bacterium]|nr:aminomethyl-transferring glycine dehydrogenase subunit GcvPA [Deltaproteobacteria bacterium]
MSYIPHTDNDIKEMLLVIGIKTVNDLFNAIPPDVRLKTPLNLPPALSEQEIVQELTVLSKKNATVEDYISFLGAGAYNHYVPSIVNHIILRSEFYTAYTPYQPEISQGTLQAVFEYQTLICQLTGMDAANASMYDGASATAEAVLMAKRLNSRSKCLLSSAFHPEYRDVVKTYIAAQNENIIDIPFCAETGTTLPQAIEKQINKDTSCVVVQHPNFFGSIEDLKTISDMVHKNGSILIVAVAEPISLGILKPPGEFGADIVVGEGQAFGNGLNFGGPYLGFFAANEKYLRNMPGRLVGETVDKNGKRGFCLTLATREQHIRREKATSNICTNEGLCALSAAIYLTALGKNGLMELARLNLSKAHYLKEQLKNIKGIKPAFTAPTFNEFVIDVNQDADIVNKFLLKQGIIGGVPLKRFYPQLKSHILLCVTEMNTKEQMDMLLEELGKAG